MRRLHLVIHGRVQGVCFRAYARDKAIALGLSGLVRNRRDGTVELMAEGEDPSLQDLLGWCWNGPPWARVEHIDADWDEANGEFSGFDISPTA